ncbi:portal protein [Cupriavidus sp. HPC(L)]|uniref:phage portal protein n=1 Tax=Cupriavidus sp. HPC(L) TaxID=1217418 RepID=UPI0003BE0CDB|nr:phage portal protein [Cupriavidus sp. HPC(L)]ESH90783.1 portal protein [Cupriavidus sp. HPC(L)]
MSVLDFFRRAGTREAQGRPSEASVPRAELPAGMTFTGLDDPALLEYIRRGQDGLDDNRARRLRNMAVLRCLSLISGAIGRLPLNLIHNGTDMQVAKDHPAYRLLKVKPNDWQTPLEFKRQIQMNTMLDGQAFARVVWSGSRPIRLIPLARKSVKPRLTDSWHMVYDYTRPDGGVVTLPAREVFHLRDLSLDGVDGISRIRLAREALDLASQAERAASRTFQTGVMAGGAIEVPKELSENAYTRMKQSMEENYSGAENAGKWMLLEEGATANKWSSTAADAQQIENRNHQIEEVARMWGVPRPLLMMDDTSWGSGIGQLGIFFVQYTLADWFTAWEEACARSLLSERELDEMQFKFNEGALLRGTLKEQAEFFAKALGAGGQKPWMTQNEVRGLSNLPESDDPQANDLRNPLTQKGTSDEPPESA